MGIDRTSKQQNAAMKHGRTTLQERIQDCDIEVRQVPVCLWGVYLMGADGTRRLKAVALDYKSAVRAKCLLPLDDGETSAIVKYDREDRRTPRNNGGGKR